MKKHTKIYLDFFGYAQGEFIPCEKCGKTAVDINHIDARGMGGKNEAADVIENLMAMCRKCHEDFGDKKQYEEMLKKIHLEFMENATSKAEVVIYDNTGMV